MIAGPPGSLLVVLPEKMAVAFINTDKPLTCTFPSPLPFNKLSSSEFHLPTIRHCDFSLSRLNYASYIIISLSLSRCSEQNEVGKGVSN